MSFPVIVICTISSFKESFVFILALFYNDDPSRMVKVAPVAVLNADINICYVCLSKANNRMKTIQKLIVKTFIYYVRVYLYISVTPFEILYLSFCTGLTF